MTSKASLLSRARSGTIATAMNVAGVGLDYSIRRSQGQSEMQAGMAAGASFAFWEGVPRLLFSGARAGLYRTMFGLAPAAIAVAGVAADRARSMGSYARTSARPFTEHGVQATEGAMQAMEYGMRGMGQGADMARMHSSLYRMALRR